MKKTAIIIVNWNGLRHLQKCFDALEKQTYKDFDVFLIDNGSKDESIEFTKKNFENIKIIELDTNTGFAKGNNIGFEHAKKHNNYDYYVCLNNDTEVHDNWLEELISKADEDELNGIVTSKIIFGDKITIQSTGMVDSNDLGFMHVGMGTNKEEFIQDHEILAPCGAAFLLKKEVLENIHGFEEDFFCYAEDVELGIRARLWGWNVVYAPKAKLYHYHSQTVGALSPFKTFYVTRNMLLLGVKLYPLPLLAKKLLNIKTRVKKYNKKITSNEQGDKLKFFLVLLKAGIAALIKFPKFYKKRKSLFKTLKVTPKKTGDILNQYRISNYKYIDNYLNKINSTKN